MEKYCLENNISFKIILIILPNILISSIIWIPMSIWCFFLHPLHLWCNLWIKIL
jgi:hypothetical protein